MEKVKFGEMAQPQGLAQEAWDVHQPSLLITMENSLAIKLIQDKQIFVAWVKHKTVSIIQTVPDLIIPKQNYQRYKN